MVIPKTALESIRVLDLGRYQAGPRAGLALARLGAEVIKIEGLGGDESRTLGPLVRGQSAYWVQYNSGKKSVTLDLRKEKGREILRDLVRISDVFIQNFRPGTIAEMGFSYEVLYDLNPRIIMLNVSAYGQYGPYRERVGFDLIGQAIGGLMSLTGYAENPPTKTGSPIIDRITALHGTIGVLAALREREASGLGQTIDVCLADTGFSLTEIPITRYLETGSVGERQRSRVYSSISDVYKTRDGWILLQVPINNDHIWSRLCSCIGKSEWCKDPRFADFSSRRNNENVAAEELAKWFSTRTTGESVSVMSDASVPCAAVNDIAQAARSPQLVERELLVEVPDPIAGTIYVSGDYIKLSRSQTVVGSPPSVSEHTEEVLHGLLHYTKDQVEQLREEKVI